MIYDPREILQKDMPLIVMSNQGNTLIGAIINLRTDGLYDHAMLSVNQGKFVCQSFTGYREIPMDQYLVKGSELKFVKMINGNDSFNAAFKDSVLARLRLPWYKKLYDFLGIFGQAIGQDWIHTPGLEYCSVDVIRHLKNAASGLPATDKELILSIPPETSPQGLDDIISKNPKVFYVYGNYISDQGVVV